MRLQIRCGRLPPLPPTPASPRTRLLRPLRGGAASPSSLALSPVRNLVVGPCSPAARPWRQSLDSQCQWNQMGVLSQPQINRLKKQWQGNGATCWSLGRDPGRRDCGDVPAALPRSPLSIQRGCRQAGLRMVGPGLQLPPSRLLIAAADKGSRRAPEFSPAPAPSNCCPGFPPTPQVL